MEDICGSGFKRAIINPIFFPFEYGCGYGNYDAITTELAMKNVLKRNIENSKPKSVHFVERNGTTTVKWKDGTITTVKCGEDDVFDKEKGVALCFMKKRMGNNGSFNEILKEWCY